MRVKLEQSEQVQAELEALLCRQQAVIDAAESLVMHAWQVPEGAKFEWEQLLAALCELLGEDWQDVLQLTGWWQDVPVEKWWLYQGEHVPRARQGLLFEEPTLQADDDTMRRIAACERATARVLNGTQRKGA